MATANLTYDTTPEFFVAFGQSNLSTSRAIQWAPPPNAMVWNNNIDGSSIGNAFATLQTSVMTPQAAFVAGRALQYPQRRVYLVQNALHDTPIAKWINSTPAPNPNMWSRLVASVNAALPVAGLSKITGFFVWEGETDALNGSTTYTADFGTVVGQFRAQSWYPSISAQTLHWLICTIGSNTRNGSPAPNADAFNAKQIKAIVEKDPFFAALINTTAWPASFWDVQGGPIGPGHILGPGCYEIGMMAARIFDKGVNDLVTHL
jgi:hypothetical protein